MSVSVIIPTYNRADMVTDAVKSVLAQTVDDVEIIVVDDGSTDETARALAPFMDRIVYLRTENQGPAGARNTGMRAARGDYIAYLDSDDLYRPFKLALQCGLLDQHKEVGMVYTEFSAFDDQGYYDEWHLRKYHRFAYARGSVSYDSIFSSSVPLVDTAYGPAALADSHPDWLSRKAWFGKIYEKYLFNTLVFTNSMVFRRSLLDEVGFQDVRLGLFEELDETCGSHLENNTRNRPGRYPSAYEYCGNTRCAQQGIRHNHQGQHFLALSFSLRKHDPLAA